MTNHELDKATPPNRDEFEAAFMPEHYSRAMYFNTDENCYWPKPGHERCSEHGNMNRRWDVWQHQQAEIDRLKADKEQCDKAWLDAEVDTVKLERERNALKAENDRLRGALRKVNELLGSDVPHHKYTMVSGVITQAVSGKELPPGSVATADESAS